MQALHRCTGNCGDWRIWARNDAYSSSGLVPEGLRILLPPANPRAGGWTMMNSLAIWIPTDPWVRHVHKFYQVLSAYPIFFHEVPMFHHGSINLIWTSIKSYPQKKGWTPQDEVLSCYGPSNRGRMCSGPLPSFSNWCRASRSSCWEPRVRPARTGEWKLLERCRGAGHGNGWIDRRQWKWRCFCYVISYIIWII